MLKSPLGVVFFTVRKETIPFFVQGLYIINSINQRNPPSHYNNFYHPNSTRITNVSFSSFFCNSTSAPLDEMTWKPFTEPAGVRSDFFSTPISSVKKSESSLSPEIKWVIMYICTSVSFNKIFPWNRYVFQLNHFTRTFTHFSAFFMFWNITRI